MRKPDETHQSINYRSETVLVFLNLVRWGNLYFNFANSKFARKLDNKASIYGT